MLLRYACRRAEFFNAPVSMTKLDWDIVPGTVCQPFL